MGSGCCWTWVRTGDVGWPARFGAWSVSTDGDGRLEFVDDRLPASGRMTFYRQNGEKLDVPLRGGRSERERTIGELQWSKQ